MIVCPVPIYYYVEIIRVLAPRGVMILNQDSLISDMEAQVFREYGFHEMVLRDGLLIAVKD